MRSLEQTSVRQGERTLVARGYRGVCPDCAEDWDLKILRLLCVETEECPRCSGQGYIYEFFVDPGEVA